MANDIIKATEIKDGTVSTDVKDVNIEEDDPSDFELPAFDSAPISQGAAFAITLVFALVASLLVPNAIISMNGVNMSNLFDSMFEFVFFGIVTFVLIMWGGKKLWDKAFGD